MSNFFGDVTAQPEVSAEFLSYWFDGQGISENSLISLVRIHPTLPRITSFTFTLEQIVGALGSDGLDPLIYSGGTFYDLYFAVSTLKEVPPGNKRGGLNNVGSVPGLWIDLDVKSGSFTDKEEVRSYLNSLEVKPSAVVWTGSGGAHAYWKLNKPQTCEQMRKLELMWWTYQQKLVNTWSGRAISVDKLCDPTRILRLPGSIRWPKKTDEAIAPVTSQLTGLEYTAEQMSELSMSSWEEHEEKLKNKRKQVENGKLAALAELKTGNYWSELIQISEIEEWFNETYSWDVLLIPMGWTCLGEDEEQRVLWSRPGDGYRKSATTDWPESPNVMSLFSSSEETGLYELYESQVVLSKYRVYVELFCQGDEALAIRTLREDFFK